MLMLIYVTMYVHLTMCTKGNQIMNREEKKDSPLACPILKACVQCTFWHHIVQNPVKIRRNQLHPKYKVTLTLHPI